MEVKPRLGRNEVARKHEAVIADYNEVDAQGRRKYTIAQIAKKHGYSVRGIGYIVSKFKDIDE